MADKCRNGHVLTAENILWDRKSTGNSYRKCRACKRKRDQRYQRARWKTQRTPAAARRDEVLALSGQGLSRTAIADRLGMSPKTVRGVLDPVWWGKYLESQRRLRRESKALAGVSKALLARHAAAMQIVERLNLNERYELLAAVVWPDSETLLNLKEGVAA